MKNSDYEPKNIVLYDSYDVRKIFENIDLIKPFEKPDMYFELEDVIIGIEQFSFSSSPKNKEGDWLTYNSKIVDENIQQEHIKTGKNKFCEHIEVKSSLNDYNNSFCETFEDHSKKISTYKTHLKDICSKKTEIYFLISDMTIDGNIIMYNGNPIFFNPTMSKKILDSIKKHHEIDGFIFECSAVFNQYIYFYLKNTEDNLNKLYEENKKYFGIELEPNNFTRQTTFYRYKDDENE